MKLTRYQDSQALRDSLSFYGLAWGYNNTIKIQGLIDVLIQMWLAGEINTDSVQEHYDSRYTKIRNNSTKRLLSNRYNK